MIEGRVARVSGPIVRATGLGGAGLYDVVEVGEQKLIGEIVRLEGKDAVVQVYEDVTGLKVGAKAVSTGRPLSVLLGPGLIGTIYDGIQRPLEALFRATGAFLQPGARGDPLDPLKKWRFEPDPAAVALLARGETLPSAPGTPLGSVRESELVVCKIMAPPGLRGRRIVSVMPAGDYLVSDSVARTDAGEDVTVAQWWPVRVPRPFARKLPPNEPLVTGQRVIDIFFPLSKGGTAAIPGGFGTGKTMTQHSVAKWCDADVIVYIGCGERGNEMTDVLTEFPEIVDPRTGRSLMERTILIANTSNMPVAAREVSIYTGVTLAEFYRDMGYHVAIMADSTSRWAEALRELSGRMEEMPAEEGFPAYLPTRLAEFYERAGRVDTLNGGIGSVTIIGAVSPPGGDFSEPVTQHTKRFIRCFWALDRDLANARHYPAVSWIDSYSEYADEVRTWWDRVNPAWPRARRSALDLLKREQRLAEIVRLIGPDALPDDQRLVLLTADLVKNGFLQQNSFDEVDMFCAPAKQVRLLELMMNFHERAAACIKLGAPLIKITSLPIRERLARLKSDVGNEDSLALVEFERELKNSFDELERGYRSERPMEAL
ncbi:MAG: V-type ATP synthase subunit A [Treponema sp. GWB1_62_6]|nr:MAG: V-type ATP synthase subunit A [Treponema sp. GWB1_62_6]OHE67693.1 MAG: V-type ATP synthase subunit A [Treponema sp. GWC1_61_84]OHE76854.1 MAG: V-type ATP synthase subunit A [Treponema sp. RIFOXYC1_FULL_61_9]HCM29056.1 V-type ATP synthase subunit A [Treponema sp.]